MNFASDNTAPVHPSVLQALAAANEGYAMSYGADPLTLSVQDQIREIFEAPDAAVYLVATGTTANALSLACLGAPWQTVFCHRHAHIQEDECGAPEFFSGGAKLTLVDGAHGKIDPDALKLAILGEQTRGVHGVQRGPLSITQTSEKGTVYSLGELKALTTMAATYGMPVHMDGSRFANALVSLGCTPAEMTWKAGIDAVSFGGTKNGLMGVEAVILFDAEKAWEFELRRKRAGHLFSKHRYLAAQMDAYLKGGLWLDMAKHANATCFDLADKLSKKSNVRVHTTPQANILFADWSRATHQKLHEAGAAYYLWSGDLDAGDPDEMLAARIVCDWSASADDSAAFLALFD
ncbi:threonine aldolase family protein [Qingshengfaniella alkalisoli]|uniref:Low specificity L-threonine aldolase n=1 Tax=Qingshengfaniella alkalisoli TaxID=2599296 RepID=A0A5B8IUA3_9RHOB|nr:beta-eliminating lyase-related protein [Qingshengfaniella alkalisoli]QDY68441.1 low specificity L-threonine aldolase [Qingshengfaniella alkalisoli]